MMKKIYNFDEFVKVNENNGLLGVIGGALSGKIDPLDVVGDGNDNDGNDVNTWGDATKSDSNGTFDPVNVYNDVPGNDDYILYLQHQQGVAGITAIIKAAQEGAPLSEKTFGTGYTHILGNIWDKSIKNDIKNALAKKDYKSAAQMFLTTWKKTWVDRQKLVKTKVLDKKYETVVNAIKTACNKYKVPFDFAVTIADIESQLIPDAESESKTYRGLFQMNINSSYDGLVKPLGNNWNNPQINADNGVKLLARDTKAVKNLLAKNNIDLKVGSWINTLPTPQLA